MMNSVRTIYLIIGLIFTSLTFANAQGFLHADGKKIVNGAGENFLSRSIGTGNWMIQEGYMMKSTDAGIHAQWEFKDKLIETIGETRTESFYNAWLENHFTKADLDSMKAWGFNSVRPALHYKLFTPPIEEEEDGQITWIDKGFTMLDSLVSWATQNEMYVFMDMHGCPGGQGENYDISDYDPSKPSLWESQENKDKLVALWKKIAERYSNESWVGGYDLINETNWGMVDGNTPLWDLHKAITAAIREVDNNHLIIIEGNGFANDFSGLPEIWDDNLALSFHKYWDFNNENSLDWMIERRDELGVPIWLGETGENSNTWFTNLITLCNENNVGWSWWPVKKGGINNILEVETNQDYYDLINYWKEGSPSMTEDEAYAAVMTWAENHKIENCFIHYDVIDAMIRQPESYESKAFKKHNLGGEIFFADYDLGRNDVAYFDTDTANHNSSTGTYTSWNAGWAYRNDGVDIEGCSDSDITNGYSVGWTSDGEWMKYSLHSDSVAAYTLIVRHAGGGSGSKIHIDVNGVNVTDQLVLPGTGDWYSWETATFENIILPAGDITIKFVLDKAGSNLNYFNFSNPKPIDNIDFVCTSAKTSTDGYEIYLDLNKLATIVDENIQIADFELLADLEPISITSIVKQASPTTVLIIRHNTELYSDNDITLTYNGSSVLSGSQELTAFTNKPVVNNLPYSHAIPGKIQAEDFFENNGLALEACDDAGEGQNTGYADPGDYLVYLVSVAKTAYYKVDYRVATTRSNAELVFQIGNGDTYTSIDTMKFTSTGDWQDWETQSSKLYLEEGHYKVKLYIKQAEHNLNWIQLTETTLDAINENGAMNVAVYPNPAKDCVTIQSQGNELGTISIYNISGLLMYSIPDSKNNVIVNTSEFDKGIYFVRIHNQYGTTTRKIVVQ
ncbi:MAG: carbohydrate-binding protein [Salinivirgaceae bacterium]|jgi:endoglucanase|nr:carbohydrate-binding protein [Salinivirgaceae bacterium]